MSSIAKILEENPHLQPVFDELSAEEKTQLDVYLAEPRMAEGFGTHDTRLGRALLESNKQRSLENKLSFARSMIHAILTDPEHRRIITSWKSLMPENEPEPFNATGSPVRFAKAPAAPPEIENRVPKYLMPKPEVRQRKPPQLNFNKNNNNNNKNEPKIKKPKFLKSKRKSKKNSRNTRKTRKN
jgi:hypothetical protein